ARSLPLLPLPWICECRWAGGADHHDVQSHGRAAWVAVERSLRQDHGILSCVTRTRSVAVGDLCGLFEAEVSRWHYRRPDLHHSRGRGDDFAELALCEVRETATG